MAVPDQRCTASLALALRRIRDTRYRQSFVIPVSRPQTNTHFLLPAAHFPRPGFCILCFTDPESRGGRSAERRSGVGGTPVGVHITRHARRLRGALRPMTQQYMGRNNVTISMPDGGSVPIVSQTEIDPMKIALSLMLAPRHDDGAPRAAARAEAARAGRLVPARLHRERLILHAVTGCCGRHRQAEQRHLPVGMDCVGLLLLAKWPRPALALRSLRFLLSRVMPCRRVAAPSSSHRFARGGDEQEGAWPRARLERMNALSVACLERAIATGSESASAAQATIVDPTRRMR